MLYLYRQSREGLEVLSAAVESDLIPAQVSLHSIGITAVNAV